MNVMTDLHPSTLPAGDETRHFASGFDLLRIVRRRIWIILASIAVITGLTALLVARTTPVYTATAAIEVVSAAPLAVTPLVPVGNSLDELIIATQVELLHSRTLARMVVDDLDLADKKEFAAPAGPTPLDRIGDLFSPAAAKSRDARRAELRGDPDAALDVRREAAVDGLLERIDVSRIGRSYLVEVSARSSDPVLAKEIADVMVGAHIKRLNAEDYAASKRAVEQLTVSVEELRQRAVDDQRKVAAYARSRNLVAANQATPDLTELGRLSGRLAEARAASAEYQARVRGVEAAGDGAAVATSALLTDLRGQEAALMKRAAELSAMFGPGHPDRIAAAAQLAEVRARMTAEVQRVGDLARNDVSVNAALERQLSGDVGQLRSQAFRQGAVGVELMDLQRIADGSRITYVNQLARLNEAMALDDKGRSVTKLAARAALPTTPTAPRPVRTLAIAFVGALILGMMIAGIAETFDTRIRTADQVDRLIGLPTLVMVPEVKRSVMRKTAVQAILAAEPNSVFAESLRTLHMELRRIGAARASHVVAITSPLPGEGKTTIAIGLAAAAAQLGRLAVVVDLDLRRPGLQQGLQRSCGNQDIVAFLEDRATIDDILVADETIPNLWTISVAVPAKDPSALLASPRLQALLEALRTRFALIVISAPPVLPVRDAKTIGEHADTTLMVLRWGKSIPSAVQAAMQRLGGTVYAAVMNAVDYKEHARRAYGDSIQYYSDYSSYFATEPPPTLKNPIAT